MQQHLSGPISDQIDAAISLQARSPSSCLRVPQVGVAMDDRPTAGWSACGACVAQGLSACGAARGGFAYQLVKVT